MDQVAVEGLHLPVIENAEMPGGSSKQASGEVASQPKGANTVEKGSEGTT